MPLKNVNCIYNRQPLTANSPRCQKKFNRSKECVLHTKKQCDHKMPEQSHNIVFDDPKWAWKSSTAMMSAAFGGLFYNEQNKFQTRGEGEAHGERRRKLGHYPFIMRDMETVIRMVIHTREYFSKYAYKNYHAAPKFLDCGCGVGNVVMMAHFAGFDAYGIEYDPVTLQRGQRLFKQFRIDPKKLMLGDILEYQKYSDYDVLYGYCPMCNHDKEVAFEHKLMLDMKIGAMLVGIGLDNGYRRIKKERIYFQRLILDADGGYGIGNPKIKVAHEKD